MYVLYCVVFCPKDKREVKRVKEKICVGVCFSTKWREMEDKGINLEGDEERRGRETMQLTRNPSIIKFQVL